MKSVQNARPGEKRTLDTLDFEIYHMTDSFSGSIRMHNHEFFELFYLRAGAMDYIIEENRYTLKEGSLLVIPPNELHRPDVRGQQSHDRIVLWISPVFLTMASDKIHGLIQDFLSVSQTSHHFRLDDERRRALEGAMRALLDEQHHQEMYKSAMCHAKLLQILILTSRIQLSAMQKRGQEEAGASALHAAETRADHDLHQVIAYINAHFTEELTTSALAERFFFNPNTLTRRFRNHTGMSVSEYIREKRLAMARLCIYQGMNVVQAGVAGGFSDYTTFYRAFRRKYGISPQAFSKHVYSEAPLMPDIMA